MDYDDEAAVSFDITRQHAQAANTRGDTLALGVEEEKLLKSKMKEAGLLIDSGARARLAVISVATHAAVPLVAAAGVIGATVGALFLPGQLAGLVWAFAVVGLPAVTATRARNLGRVMRNRARRKALASIVAERGSGLALQSPFAIPTFTSDEPKALQLNSDGE